VGVEEATAGTLRSNIMLYVEFNDGVVEKHKVRPSTWDHYGNMIVWLMYNLDEVGSIDRILYLSPPTGG
jgi:hypothetical protein